MARSIDRHRFSWLLVVTALCLAMFDYAGYGPIRSAREQVLVATSPVQTLFSSVLDPAGNAWNGAVNYEKLERENELLRQQLLQQQAQRQAPNNTEYELRELLAGVELPYLGDVEKVAVKTVSTRSNETDRVIEINKGTQAGIRPGMAVVNSLGLVGEVELVTSDRSVVRLLTDPQTVVGLRSVDGLAVGIGNGVGLSLERSPELSEAFEANQVTDGELLVTAGVPGARFPSGIPVGALLVSAGPGVESSNKILEIELFATPESLMYLTVLMTEQAA